MEPRTGGPVGAPEKGKTAFRPFPRGPVRLSRKLHESDESDAYSFRYSGIGSCVTYIVNDETIHTTKNNNRRNRRPDCNHNRLSMPHRYNHHNNNNNNNNMLPLMIPLTLLVLVGWSSAVSADSTPLLEEVVPLR